MRRTGQRRKSVIADISPAAAPPPLLTVSQWADAKRRLPETSGASGAQWRTDSTPYLRGIMDAVHEPGVRKIAVMKGAQLGGSEALHNILGYFIEHDPCPMLFVHPTAEVAEEWSKERLADMIRSSPALAAVINEKRRGRSDKSDGESTLALKLFAGGFLALGGANTPNTFARRSVRIAIGDDVDRFPAVVGDEGDPTELLMNRTTTFYDALGLFVSTPTLKGGRIDALYQRSDQRRFFIRCPDCDHEDWITWSDATHFRVGFDDRDADSARLECPMCDVHHDDIARRALVKAGVWRPTQMAQERGLIGFHVPSMLSTLGNVSLATLVEKWIIARATGKDSLRVFINTSLAEGWEDRGARLEPHVFMNRREEYGAGVEVPAPAVALTAGVDVQADYFQIQVVAWGLAGERWVVDWRTVPGDPRKPDTQAALLEALKRRYVHATGHLLPIHATCIDSGYATDEVYDFVLAHQARRIFATKGYAGKGGNPIVGKPNEKTRGKDGRPVKLYPINVDDAKAEIYGSLSVLTAGPGSWHFPLELEALNEEYFAQLCSEHRETRYNRAGVATHSVWVTDRDRNEGLDTAVGALSAQRIFNPNIRQMLEMLAGLTPATAPADGAPAVTATAAVAARHAARRVTRSNYLG